MYYFLHGSDEEKSRSKFDALVLSLREKRNDTGFFRMDSLSWDRYKLEEYLHSQNLFGNRYVIALNKVFESPEAEEFIISNLERFENSQNIFFFLEGVVKKTTLNKISEHSEKVQEFAKRDTQDRFGKAGFNIFAITDAFGERNKRKLWVLLQKANFAGEEAEEVFWRLAWMVKAMIIASLAKSAKEADQKPFVYQKCSGFARNYTQKELALMYSNLSRIYHEARKGRGDFDIAIERLALSI